MSNCRVDILHNVRFPYPGIPKRTHLYYFQNTVICFKVQYNGQYRKCSPVSQRSLRNKLQTTVRYIHRSSWCLFRSTRCKTGSNHDSASVLSFTNVVFTHLKGL